MVESTRPLFNYTELSKMLTEGFVLHYALRHNHSHQFLSCCLMMKYSLFYLESLNTLHPTVAAAPHKSKPPDPVVGGHGGVPDPAPPVVHALLPGQDQLKTDNSRELLIGV